MGFEIKESQYPTKTQQLNFLRTYFKHFYARDPSSEELKEFYREVNIFSLASHLFWGIWAILQARFNNLIDFDYKSYSVRKIGLVEKNLPFFFENDGEQEFVYLN